MLNTLNINLKTDIKNDRPTALGIKLMSQDKNNNQFILRFTNGGEPVVLDSIYTIEILTKFTNSGASRLTSATVRQDYATWEFDTAYITQDEMVYNYVYVRKAGNLVVSADANAFYFDVGLSEIDKGAGKVAETYDENYQKYLDEFKDNVDFEEIAQAEQARKEAELLREENYNQKVDTAIVEADVVSKVDNKVTELTPQITNLTAQLADKIGGGVKAEPEDLSATTLALVTGTGGPINLLTVPQDSSVTKTKLSPDLKSEANALFPPDPNTNEMDILNNSQTTVSYFGNAANTAYAEPIVNGIKEYTISTNATFNGATRPYIAIGNKFDVLPSTDYLFTCEGDASVNGIFTMIITDGTNTLDTKYIGYTAGTTSKSQAITTPAGATKLEITLFGFNVSVAGENHLTIRNLQLKTTLAQDPDIITRTEALETDVTAIDGRVGALENVPQKSYFILDFDYSPLAWTDANIAIVLDEFGYPFKFNYGTTSDAAIARALIRRGCEMATYFNDAAYLPTTEQLSSTDPTDIAKVDAYVKGAIDMQETLGFKDQLVWSTRQFTTGINLENALKKYGFAIERLRTSGTMLPTSFSKNQLTKIYVSDNTTNWYQHTLDGIDLAIASGGSLAIFTHKIVPTDDASGINIIESQYRLILNKIKGYVDAGQAEVITYRDYFGIFKEDK